MKKTNQRISEPTKRGTTAIEVHQWSGVPVKGHAGNWFRPFHQRTYAPGGGAVGQGTHTGLGSGVGFIYSQV